MPLHGGARFSRDVTKSEVKTGRPILSQTFLMAAFTELRPGTKPDSPFSHCEPILRLML